MTNDGTWTYTWEHGREVATMSSGGTTWTYTYDADGMRTKRTSGSSTYTYAYIGGQLTYMSANGQDVYITHDASGQPMTINYNGTTYYYATNLQGDVTAIVNTSGMAVVTYTYDAWGNILATSGPMATNLGVDNPLRYRGYVYDPETGLYYLQSRYYNPALGRFINSDAFVSSGQGVLGHNMFAYCGNDPVNRIDAGGDYWRYVVNDSETKEIEEKDDGTITYRTTITYTAIEHSIFGCLLDAEVIRYEVTFEYSVSPTGLIIYDNAQPSAKHLELEQVRDALAKEMFAVTTQQVQNSLAGRTSNGLSLELLIHFIVFFYKIPFYYDRSLETEMGNIDKHSKAYDWNAAYFEFFVG